MAACHLSTLIIFLSTLLSAGAAEVRIKTPDYPVNGSLGHSVWLPVDIDADLQNAEITWRLSGPPDVTIARFYVDENKTKIFQGRFSGRAKLCGNFTLQINKLSKLDEGNYTVTVTTSVDERGEVSLQVYDPVSNPKIELINRTAGESCNVTLRCSVERGDGVIYNWSPLYSVDTNHSTELGSRSAEQLDVSVGMSDSIAYLCTAWNPISKESTMFSKEKPCQQLQKDSSDFLNLWLTIIIASISITAIIIFAIFYKRRWRSEHENAEDLTVLSQHLKRVPTIPNNYENIVQSPEPLTVYATIQNPSNT